MDESTKDLLSKLARNEVSDDGSDPWQLVEAINPEEDDPATSDSMPASGKSLDDMLERINRLADKSDTDKQADEEPSKPVLQDAEPDFTRDFYPVEPETIAEASLSASEVESLTLKFLLSSGEASGRQIAMQICLPFLCVDEALRKMKYDQLVVYKDTAHAGDYVYFLTDLGRERARRYAEHCTYFGSAPVSLEDYVKSVRAQSLENQNPSMEQLEEAFQDLLINKNMFRRIGPAINSGRGLFLYGAPGNGKTSIAERVTRAFGRNIWVPRSIGIGGEILRVFDPAVHDEVPLEEGSGLLQEHKIDRRWVRIKRPTIIVGGELTMASLEISTVASTGVCEAPLQLKSNCGTLVIDDFGRQRMSTDELLNRWIVPLEKRYDFLNMRGGKKIQVPFDQLIVFSTNLEPRDLCDDAFLRRIPYKIEVVDPTESEFRQLFRIMCPLMGFPLNEEAINHLIDQHYRKVDRPFRCCQPRDLLMQVRNLCLYENKPLELSEAYFDDAVENYFAVV